MKLLLVIQRDLPIAAEPFIAAWQRQLEAEGYQITRAYGPKANPKLVGQARDFAASTVWPWVRANPGGYVFLLGDLPMPRTGFSINPDGHPGSSGAYASTLYYACPSDNWTDEGDNLGFLPRPALKNIPGDGHFDQQGAPRDGVPGSVGPVLAHVGFFNPYYNPKTFGSPLDSLDYVVDCLRRYFTLNLAYRQGELRPSKVGLGVDKGAPPPGLVAWAREEVGTDSVILFDRAKSTTLTEPFLFLDDFKGLSESNAFWSTRATGQLCCVFDRTWGSYQVDYRSLRLANPLNCGTLAVGNMGRSWNLTGLWDKTLGELWRQTVLTGQVTTHIVLYGDPTLRLQR